MFTIESFQRQLKEFLERPSILVEEAVADHRLNPLDVLDAAFDLEDNRQIKDVEDVYQLTAKELHDLLLEASLEEV